MKQVSLQLKGHFSDDLSHYSSVCAHRQAEKAGSWEYTDHYFWCVPESRDLLGTEALVSRAFELVVGRKVTITHYRGIGAISKSLAGKGVTLVQGQVQGLTMEGMSINIVSYNCSCFRSSSGHVKQLLEQCDTLCLQEHWLLDHQLCDLNICQNFAVTGVSGMASDCVIHGCPYGGCAV